MQNNNHNKGDSMPEESKAYIYRSLRGCLLPGQGLIIFSLSLLFYYLGPAIVIAADLTSLS